MSSDDSTPKNLLNAETQTVQAFPDAENGLTSSVWSPLATYSYRDPLLPRYGTRQRELALRRLYHNPHSTTFGGATAGITKRIQSTPFEIEADKRYGDYWQQLLMLADFGSWDRFLSKLIVDFMRQDIGAFIEIIAPGNPESEPTGAVTGIAVLDAMRCYPTGDPEYPVYYLSNNGEYHKLHRSRVVRFVDMSDSDADMFGMVGQCALSRAVAPVSREILMAQYIQTKLDDKPPPGILLLNNISKQQEAEMIERRDREASTDAGNEWGRTLKFYGLNPEKPLEAQFITYSQAPDSWDFEKYTNLNVKQIALAMGVDIQDIWELTGGGIGTATQSQVLAQKARGKAIGRILKGLERVINRVLPEDAEFTFKYQDAQEDIERANTANQWASFSATTADVLPAQARAEILANQVEAVRDAITDADGNMIRLDDSDPESASQFEDDVQNVEQVAPQTQVSDEGDRVLGDTKEASITRNAFAQEFIDLVRFAQDGVVPYASIRARLRGILQDRGTDMYIDGVQDAGSQMTRLDETGRERVATWRAKQNQFINNFINEIKAKPLDEAQLRARAQLWVNMSLNPIYFRGLEDGAPRQHYLWVVNPLKEHCITCLRLNGQVHQLKTFRRLNLLPQSRSLVCGGWRCGCDIIKTNERARGNIRAVRFVRGRREHNHKEFNHGGCKHVA